MDIPSDCRHPVSTRVSSAAALASAALGVIQRAEYHPSHFEHIASIPCLASTRHEGILDQQFSTETCSGYALIAAVCLLVQAVDGTRAFAVATTPCACPAVMFEPIWHAVWTDESSGKLVNAALHSCAGPNVAELL